MSPDLITIWGEAQQRVYETKVNDVDEPKQRRIGCQAAWDKASSTKEFVEWCKRRSACICTKHKFSAFTEIF